MSYTTVRTAAKTAAKLAIEALLPTELASVQVVTSFEHVELHSRRIEVGANATPQVAGDTILGWTVELLMNAVTDSAQYTDDEHEALTAVVESLALATDLNTRLTSGGFNVQFSTPGASGEEIIEGYRVTTFSVEVNAYLT